MKQTYLIIFLLSIILICAFCKYSKHNNQVIENFLTDEQTAEIVARATQAEAVQRLAAAQTEGQESRITPSTEEPEILSNADKKSYVIQLKDIDDAENRKAYIKENLKTIAHLRQLYRYIDEDNKKEEEKLIEDDNLRTAIIEQLKEQARSLIKQSTDAAAAAVTEVAATNDKPAADAASEMEVAQVAPAATNDKPAADAASEMEVEQVAPAATATDATDDKLSADAAAVADAAAEAQLVTPIVVGELPPLGALPPPLEMPIIFLSQIPPPSPIIMLSSDSPLGQFSEDIKLIDIINAGKYIIDNNNIIINPIPEDIIHYQDIHNLTYTVLKYINFKIDIMDIEDIKSKFKANEINTENDIIEQPLCENYIKKLKHNEEIESSIKETIMSEFGISDGISSETNDAMNILTITKGNIETLIKELENFNKQLQQFDTEVNSDRLEQAETKINLMQAKIDEMNIDSDRANYNSESLIDHCFSEGNGLNGLCDNIGCKIDCSYKNVTGECVSHEDTPGGINLTLYENAFGSSIIGHKHIHTHGQSLSLSPSLSPAPPGGQAESFTNKFYNFEAFTQDSNMIIHQYISTIINEYEKRNALNFSEIITTDKYIDEYEEKNDTICEKLQSLQSMKDIERLLRFFSDKTKKIMNLLVIINDELNKVKQNIQELIRIFTRIININKKVREYINNQYNYNKYMPADDFNGVMNNLCFGSSYDTGNECVQSEWGCKLDCDLKNNGECVMGSNGYNIYTDIYGNSVKIHSHIHDYEHHDYSQHSGMIQE